MSSIPMWSSLDGWDGAMKGTEWPNSPMAGSAGSKRQKFVTSPMPGLAPSAECTLLQ